MDKNDKKTKKKLSRKQSLILFISLFVVICALIGLYDIKTFTQSTKVEFTEFEKQLNAGEINVVYFDIKKETKLRYVTFADSNANVDMTVKEREKAAGKSTVIYETNSPMYEDFHKDMLSQNVVVVDRPYTLIVSFGKAAGQVAYLGFMLGMVYIMATMYAPLMSGANTSVDTQDKSVSFDDIIGLDETVEEIKFLMRVMQNKELRQKHNLKQPKGLLLSGPPGTGKTMIAKAISNELNMKFIYVDSSSLIEMFVGLGASRVRKIFAEAKKKKPCVIFFDELDSVGKQRGSNANSSENDQVINSLLQELDGFKTDSGIFVIGATNFSEQLDKALIRPGRFDRKLVINPPKDWIARKKMFEHYLKDEDLTNVNLENIARQCSGFTGADIAQVVNEAKMLVVANELDGITTDVLEEAIDKTWLKGNRTKYSKDKDLKISAYHESGHALSSLLNGNKIARISITPSTSGIGGMVVTLEDEELYITKSELINRVKMAYSGRIAEEIVFGKDNITTGAKQDITVATQMLTSYVSEYGFDDSTGLCSRQALVENGLSVKDEIVSRISELSKELYTQAYDEILEHKDILYLLADKIMERETMDGEEFTNYYNECLKEREHGECKKVDSGRS